MQVRGSSLRRGLAALIGVSALVVPLAAPAAATAHTFDESSVGDASGTVQSPTDIGGAVTVTGSIGSTTDVDAYAVCLGSDPLLATVTSSSGDPFLVPDFSLYLFAPDGEGLLYNEDSSTSLDPQLDESAYTTASGIDFAAGSYVIALSASEHYPVTSDGTRIFPATDNETKRLQHGPVAPDLIVAAWNSGSFPGDPGSYSMTLEGSVPCTTTPPDTDGDGVLDLDDHCPGSSINDTTDDLKNKRYHTVEGNFVALGATSAYATLADTAGCTFTQIIDALMLPDSHKRLGISERNLDQWIDQVPTL